MKYKRLVDAKSIKIEEPKKESNSFWKSVNSSDFKIEDYRFLKTNE